MNILLTNDDGYNSTGIVLLKKKLEKYGRVVIVAPLKHMSAKSCAITLGVPIKVEEIEKDLFVVDAMPADCAEFALTALDIKFDLVISGCNNGWNISFDTMYSGTIGAALQALKHRIPAIAVSCECNFDIVDRYFDDVFEFIQTNKLLTSEYILNVNFPIGTVVNAIKFSKLHYRIDHTYYVKQDGGYLALRTVEDEKENIAEDSDVYQVNHGIISITPLGKSYYNDSYYDDLKTKI